MQSGVQRLRLGDLPGFTESDVESEDARTAQFVPLSRFARVGEPESLDGGGGILEDVGLAVDNECSRLGPRAVHDCGRSQFPVGCPETKTRTYREGQPATPAGQTGELPAANNGIRPAAHSRGVGFAVPKGKLVYPVGFNLVRGVEIGNGM